MPIRIEPSADEIEEYVKERETIILDLMNVKLLTLDETAGKQELERTAQRWMEPLGEAVSTPQGMFDLRRLVPDETYLREENDESESRLFERWRTLRNIWGYRPHHSYELITHCSRLNFFQSWTDPIMRILSRHDFHAFPTDSFNKARASKSNDDVQFTDFNWARTKAFALWAVYFDQPEVLGLIKEICEHKIGVGSSYAMATLVTFTRAWVLYCLQRNPTPFLDNVMTLRLGGPPAEEEGSSTDSEAVGECSPPRKKGRGAYPGSKWVV